MKTNKIGLLLGLLLGTLAATMLTKPVQAGCSAGCWNRVCAKSYALSAVNTPYVLNHAEWSPDSVETWEGVDCSGMVYKTWGMKGNTGFTDFFWWFKSEVLPPEKYFARNFYAGCSGACTTVCEGGNGTCPPTLTDEMDAFVTLGGSSGPEDDHVGLIYTEQGDYSDLILEATRPNVIIQPHAWRRDTHYLGIKREGESWSWSCPLCPDKCPVHLPFIRNSVPTPYYCNPNLTPGSLSPEFLSLYP